jgi:trk system potassium uptake protein TrkA
MNFIIIGCGRVGAELAYRLFQDGHQLVVIDHVAAAFNNLPPDFRGRTIEGEALNRDVLQRAGIQEAHGVAAATNNDALNAVVAHVARETYQVPNVIVRNYDPGLRSMHEAFGFQVVSSSSWGAQRIEEFLYNTDFQPVYSAGNGEVEIYEFKIPARWVGRSLAEMLGETEVIPVALTRGGRSFLPARELILERDDLLNISATLKSVQALRQKLFTPEA